MTIILSAFFTIQHYEISSLFSILARSNAIGLTGAIFGPGSYTIPIHLDNVNCQESATSLLNCTHDPIGQHGCFHTEDVSVDCLGRDIGNAVLC